MNTERNREDALTLEILDVVQKQSDVSQRHLAQHLGVALGLANSYLKRCVRKGLIKITEAPANRYFYYLTPIGFAEKSRLTAQYLSYSFSFYRQASESCMRVFDRCRDKDWRQLLLCGVSDLAEIASLRAAERGIVIIGFYDPRSERKRYLDRPVWREFGMVGAYDACMVTDFLAPQMIFDHMAGLIGRDRVLAPDVLGLSTNDHDSRSWTTPAAGPFAVNREGKTVRSMLCMAVACQGSGNAQPADTDLDSMCCVTESVDTVIGGRPRGIGRAAQVLVAF